MQLFPKQTRNTLLAFVFGLIIIMVIGYADYLTGDYSLDVFYLAVVFIVSWFAGAGCGLVCVLESLLSEVVSDYYVHSGNVFTGVYFWSWASDLLIFSTFCLLVSVIRRKLASKE